MPKTIESLPPDTDPTSRGLLINPGRCHAVQVVRHVPLPQLEALHGMHTDNGETKEDETFGAKLSSHESDDKAIEAYQGSDIRIDLWPDART
jgi:hypothetical protein